MLPELENCSSEERLDAVELFSFEQRRMRDDLTEVFKDA